MLKYPQIDPVAITIFNLNIHWYGIAYLVGILLGWLVLRLQINKHNFKIDHQNVENFIPWVTVGIIVGGKIGHVILYDFGYYLEHPLEILMIWQPGMAFHGGLVGVIVVSLLFCAKYKIKFLALTDAIAFVAPIGIFFGRIANFINGELIGRVSNIPFAMVFPGSDGYARHPSQLYEALLEGAGIFVIQYLIMIQSHYYKSIGRLSGTFLLIYAVARFIAEYFREPTDGFIKIFTVGQFLSLLMFCAGLLILLCHQKRN